MPLILHDRFSTSSHALTIGVSQTPTHIYTPDRRSKHNERLRRLLLNKSIWQLHWIIPGTYIQCRLHSTETLKKRATAHCATTVSYQTTEPKPRLPTAVLGLTIVLINSCRKCTQRWEYCWNCISAHNLQTQVVVLFSSSAPSSVSRGQESFIVSHFGDFFSPMMFRNQTPHLCTRTWLCNVQPEWKG